MNSFFAAPKRTWVGAISGRVRTAIVGHSATPDRLPEPRLARAFGAKIDLVLYAAGRTPE